MASSTSATSPCLEICRNAASSASATSTSLKSSKWTINEAKDTEAFYSLDLQQRKAVEEAIKGPITLIEGPPGSGKTRIAAGIVEEKFGEQNFLVFSEMRGKHLYYYRP